MPGGDCLIIGGGDGYKRKNVYRYLASKNELVRKTNLIIEKHSHASVALGNIVYVMSGLCNSTTPESICEVYDAQNDKVKSMASMNKGRYSFSATIINSQYIYAFGGQTSSDNYLDSIERYNISGNSWQTLNMKLSVKRANTSCFCPNPNEIVLFGGSNSTHYKSEVL